MGSAGAKAMAVVRGEADVYAHAGGQYEWDSAAPAAVALAAGLHVSRRRRLRARVEQARPVAAPPADLPRRARRAGRRGRAGRHRSTGPDRRGAQGRPLRGRRPGRHDHAEPARPAQRVDRADARRVPVGDGRRPTPIPAVRVDRRDRRGRGASAPAPTPRRSTATSRRAPTTAASSRTSWPRPGYGVRPEFDHAFAFHFGLTEAGRSPPSTAPPPASAWCSACFCDLRFAAAGAKLTTSAPRLGPARRVRPVVGPPPPRRHRPRRRPAAVQPGRPGRGGRRMGLVNRVLPARRAAGRDATTYARIFAEQVSPAGVARGQGASSTPTSTATSAPPSPSPSACWRRWCRAPTSPKASPPGPSAAHPGSRLAAER